MSSIVDYAFDVCARAKAAYVAGHEYELALCNDAINDVLDAMTEADMDAMQDDWRYRQFRDLVFALGASSNRGAAP